jgi:hypothetical protein
MQVSETKAAIVEVLKARIARERANQIETIQALQAFCIEAIETPTLKNFSYFDNYQRSISARSGRIIVLESLINEVENKLN